MPDGRARSRFSLPSTADAAHRALRLLEFRFPDVVSFLLAQRHLSEPRADRRVGIALSEHALEVMLADAEEAGAHLAVGREADAVAVAAEGFRHRGDDPDLGFGIRKAPAPGGFGRVGGLNGDEVEPLLEPLEDFTSGHDEIAEPGAAGVERHELNEAQLQAFTPRELRQVLNLVIVQ